MVLFSCESTIRKPRPDGTKGQLNMVGKERGWQTLRGISEWFAFALRTFQFSLKQKRELEQNFM
jgi:hypothetical protein